MDYLTCEWVICDDEGLKILEAEFGELGFPRKEDVVEFVTDHGILQRVLGHQLNQRSFKFYLKDKQCGKQFVDLNQVKWRVVHFFKNEIVHGAWIEKGELEILASELILTLV